MLEGIKNTLHRSNELRFVYWFAVLNFIDLLAKYLPSRLETHGSKKRVIFFRMDGIGDYVIWSRTFGSFDAAFPRSEYERILVGNEVWQDLARESGVFDQAIFASQKNAVFDPLYRFRLVRKIRRLSVDISINPRTSREFVLMDSMVRVSAAKQRVGCAGLANRMNWLQQKISDRWYTRLIEGPEQWEHELAFDLRLLSEFAGIELGPDPISARARERDNVVVFFLGAQETLKRWPVASFVELAGIITQKYGMKAVLCGGPAEKPLADLFCSDFPGEVDDQVGKLSLSELRNIIGKSRLTISGDTVAGHIAAAEACPSVVIHPGRFPGRYFPYPTGEQITLTHPLDCSGCSWKCIYQNELKGAAAPCVSGVSVDQVIEAVDRLMQTDARQKAARTDTH